MYSSLLVMLFSFIPLYFLLFGSFSCTLIPFVEIHKMLEWNIFKNDLIHFLFNKASKRLGTSYQLARTEWDWGARLLTVRPIIFFPVYNSALFLFDLETSLLICILFWNRGFYHPMWEKLDCFSYAFLLDFGLSCSIEPEKFTPCNLFPAFLPLWRKHRLDWIHIFMYVYFLSSWENSDPSDLYWRHWNVF